MVVAIGDIVTPVGSRILFGEKESFAVIGVYDRTVVLTYLSLASAVCGCIISAAGTGHPYLGGFFLLFCGLCDTFDGIVARSKKDRTDRELAFGAQIDSLSDLVAFGILPSAIAVGLLAHDGIQIIPIPVQSWMGVLSTVGFLAIVLFYCLAALIRLAYFNVLDEERRHSGDTGPKYFVGLPVTSAALVFPVILLMNYFIPRDLSLLYTALMVVAAFLFLGSFRIRRPSGRKARALERSLTLPMRNLDRA